MKQGMLQGTATLWSTSSSCSSQPRCQSLDLISTQESCFPCRFRWIVPSPVIDWTSARCANSWIPATQPPCLMVLQQRSTAGDTCQLHLQQPHRPDSLLLFNQALGFFANELITFCHPGWDLDPLEKDKHTSGQQKLTRTNRPAPSKNADPMSSRGENISQSCRTVLTPDSQQHPGKRCGCWVWAFGSITYFILSHFTFFRGVCDMHANEELRGISTVNDESHRQRKA